MTAADTISGTGGSETYEDTVLGSPRFPCCNRAVRRAVLKEPLR